MKKSKILSLLVVSIMVLVVAMGCRPAEPQPQDPQPETPPAAEAPADEEPQYQDGEYRAEGERGERGWMPFIEITVVDGAIATVRYDEEHEDGRLKSEDDEYNERWEAQAGISAEGAFPTYENTLIETQNVEAVEAVTGATATYNDFVEVARMALEEAGN